jgi:hypothetical protein
MLLREAAEYSGDMTVAEFIMEELRAFLTEERTDDLIMYIRDKVDIPFEGIVAEFIDQLLPDSLLDALGKILGVD